jgi:hypothetical protein
MRRTSLKSLLLGVTALVLALDGCSSSVSVNPASNQRARAIVADDGEKKQEKGAPFRLPDDQAGRLLGEVLPPTAPGVVFRAVGNDTSGTFSRDAPVEREGTAPTRSAAASQLNVLGVTSPRVEYSVSRLPQPTRKEELRPRLVVEEGLGELFDEPAVPRRPSFAIGRRTSTSSPDAAVPPPLPVMAQPVPDRVPLDDATAEASKAAALAAELPRRSRPAPFVRMRVPEPFANRRPLTTKVPDEETTPVAAVPSPPTAQ